MIFVDPQTRQRIPLMPHTGDFTYMKQGDDAICNEDVPVVGEWKDYTGSGGTPTHMQTHFASSENSLQGTEADIDGHVKLPNLSVVGTRTGTHRRRQIMVYHEAI